MGGLCSSPLRRRPGLGFIKVCWFLQKDAFASRKDKVSLNVDEDDDSGDEFDEEAVMSLGGASDEDASGSDDEEDDEDVEDEEDIIEAALQRGGKSAKCEWAMHLLHGRCTSMACTASPIRCKTQQCVEGRRQQGGAQRTALQHFGCATVHACAGTSTHAPNGYTAVWK